MSERETFGKCPTCAAPRPNFHPCMGFEAEVEVCPDDYHLIDVPENLPEFKDAVLAKRAAQQARLANNNGRK